MIREFAEQPDEDYANFCHELTDMVKDLTEKKILDQRSALYKAGRDIVALNQVQMARKTKALNSPRGSMAK